MNRPDAWGGVIHRAASPEFKQACQRLRDTDRRLQVAGVLRDPTVGPVYAKTKDKSHLLANCYRNALALPCLDRENKAALLFVA